MAAYSTYRKANTRPNADPGAYSSYNNSNEMAVGREAPFNIIRARHAYSTYRNENGVISGPYGGYNNSNGRHGGGAISMAVPTNVGSRRVLGMDNENGTNAGNNPTNSLRICMGIHPRPIFRHENSSI